MITTPWTPIGRVEVSIHAFLNSALDRGESSAPRPGRFIPTEVVPSKHWIGGGRGGPQSRSRHGEEEKNSQPLPVLELPIIQPAAQRYTTELTWLPLNSQGLSEFTFLVA
jgi:hypothetical protein